MNPELEAALAAGGSKATYGGAGVIGMGWLLSSEFAILIGIIVGVAGFLVNWFYKARQDRRDEREHQARMAEIGRHE